MRQTGKSSFVAVVWFGWFVGRFVAFSSTKAKLEIQITKRSDGRFVICASYQARKSEFRLRSSFVVAAAMLINKFFRGILHITSQSRDKNRVIQRSSIQWTLYFQSPPKGLLTFFHLPLHSRWLRVRLKHSTV